MRMVIISIPVADFLRSIRDSDDPAGGGRDDYGCQPQSSGLAAGGRYQQPAGGLAEFVIIKNHCAVTAINDFGFSGIGQERITLMYPQLTGTVRFTGFTE